MSKEKASLDIWINQHLEAREERMRSMDSPFNWHQPSANDLRPTTVEVVDLNQPIEFK